MQITGADLALKTVCSEGAHPFVLERERTENLYGTWHCTLRHSTVQPEVGRRKADGRQEPRAEYNNRRPGRSGDGNAGRDAGGQAGTTGTSSSVTVFLSTLLFSSSHFYYLFCRKLQQQTGRGRVGSGRTGQRGRR